MVGIKFHSTVVRSSTKCDELRNWQIKSIENDSFENKFCQGWQGKTRISLGTRTYKLIYFFRSVAARTMPAGFERILSSSLHVISCTTLKLKPYNNQYIIMSFHFEDFIPTDND